MVSLSYFDEHRAWQQRVHREIKIANRSRYTLNSPNYQELKPQITYRYKTIDDKSTVSETKQEKHSDVESVNVFEEVRGKYSRPAYNREALVLPQLKSRGSSSVTSRKNTANSFFSQGLEEKSSEFDGKSLDELKKMLRQEKLRRMRAERELKKKTSLPTKME